MREGDPLLPFVEALTDPDTAHAIGLTEHSPGTEGGCQLPFGAYVPSGTRKVFTYLGEAAGLETNVVGRVGLRRKEVLSCAN